MRLLGPRILAIGDSITQDTVAPLEGAYRYYLGEPFSAWFGANVQWVGEMQAYGTNSWAGNKMCGVSGRRVDMVLSTDDPGGVCLRQQPNLVIIGLLTNESTQLNSGAWVGGSEAIAIANYSTLLTTVFANVPADTLVCCIKITPNGTAGADTIATSLNAALVTMIAAHPNASRIFTADCNAAFRNYGDWLADLMNDNTHPNSAGKSLMASTILTAIQSNITLMARTPASFRKMIRPHTGALRYTTSTVTALGAFELNTALPWAVSMDIDLSRSVLTANNGLLRLATDQSTPFIFLALIAGRYLEWGSSANFDRFFGNVAIDPNIHNRVKSQWVTLTWTFNGVSRTADTSYKFYINRDSVAVTNGAGLIASTDDSSIGGAVSGGVAGIFDMANLTIWNGGTTMTAAQVAAWSDNYIFPSGPTLVRNFPHTDLSGTTLTDTTGGGNATIGTAAWVDNLPTRIRQPINGGYTQSWGFNGSSSSITSNSVIDFSGGLKYVFDFWYQPLATGGAAELVTNNTTSASTPSNTFRFLRGNTAKTLNLQWFDAGGSQQWTTGELDLGYWHHIIGVIDATTGAKVCKVLTRGMLNGSLGTNTATGGTNFLSDSLRVDKQSGGTGPGAIRCNIKDLRMFTFTGTWADSDGVKFYQGQTPSGYTLVHRWIGEDAGVTADDSAGSIDMTLTSVTYDTTVPSKARTAATTRTQAS